MDLDLLKLEEIDKPKLTKEGYIQYDLRQLIFEERFEDAKRILEAHKKGEVTINKKLLSKSLFQAISKGSLDIINALIDAGVDVNKMSYLELAMLGDDYPNNDGVRDDSGIEKIVSALIKAGADVNGVTHEIGYTPIMLAALYGKTDTMVSLFNMGAKVNVRNIDNDTVMNIIHFKGKIKRKKYFDTFMLRAMKEGYRPIETDPEEMKSYYNKYVQSIREVELQKKIPLGEVSKFFGGKRKLSKKNTKKMKKSKRKTTKRTKTKKNRKM